MLAAEPRSETATQLPVLVDRATDSDHEEAVRTTESVSDTVVQINPAVIESVIEEVLDNAVRHGNNVTVTVSYDPATTTLTVADDGPGIPDHEITVLENAQETDLQHGSGLGLWLIKWGVDSFGGSVSFETDTRGTTVQIELPAALVETNK